jgi:uncharacterized protein (TIGR03382 family)
MLLVLLAHADERADLDRAVAERWAPVIYQDVADGAFNDSDMRRRDLLSPVDFDGNFDPFDDVEDVDSGDFPLHGAVYYDVVETETHWFILYAFFHGVDWSPIGTVDHENDMEHAWLVVEKHVDGSATLQVLHTQAHGQLFGWSNEEVSGRFALSAGGISFEGDHPRLFIEAHGHGPASCTFAGGLPFTETIDCAPPSDEDMVVYRVSPGVDPEDVPEPDVSDGALVEAEYALVSARDTLWPLRFDIDDPEVWDEPVTYAPGRNADADTTNDIVIDPSLAAFGTDFAGDEGGGGGVPPWGYAVHDSYLGGTSFGATGDWLLDPAFLFSELYRDVSCSDREPFFNYLSNPYLDSVLAPDTMAPWDGVDHGRRCDGTVFPEDTGSGDTADSGDPGDTATPDSGDQGDSGTLDTAPPGDTGKPATGGAQADCGCASTGGDPAGFLAVALALAVIRGRRVTVLPLQGEVARNEPEGAA